MSTKKKKHYSEEFKKAAVEKMQSRDGPQMVTISEEMGIPRPTLYLWKKEFANVVGMKKQQQCPQSKSAKEKFRAVLEL